MVFVPLKIKINLKKQSKIQENPSLWKTKKVKLQGSKVLDLDKLTKFVQENPDKYYHEIAQNFGVSDEQIRKLVRDKLGYTSKKNRKFTKNLTQKKDKNI